MRAPYRHNLVDLSGCHTCNQRRQILDYDIRGVSREKARAMQGRCAREVYQSYARGILTWNEADSFLKGGQGTQGRCAKGKAKQGKGKQGKGKQG